jgi:hypothetical protein
MTSIHPYMFRHRSAILKGAYSSKGIQFQNANTSTDRTHGRHQNTKILKFYNTQDWQE